MYYWSGFEHFLTDTDTCLLYPDFRPIPIADPIIGTYNSFTNGFIMFLPVITHAKTCLKYWNKLVICRYFSTDNITFLQCMATHTHTKTHTYTHTHTHKLTTITLHLGTLI